MKRTVLILLVAAVAFAWSTPKFGSFRDPRDGQVYKTVKIGDQTWMAQNLNYGKALEGKAALSSGEKWCYGDTLANCEKYGGLYSWDVAQNSCPAGWHLPKIETWIDLKRFIIRSFPNKVCSKKYLDGSCKEWQEENLPLEKELRSKTGWENTIIGNGNDTFGFGGLPAGSHHFGIFVSFFHGWWLDSEFDRDNAWMWAMGNGDSESSLTALSGRKEEGYSIRCVKD